jgi:AcrR family transcriptional regulator
VIEGLSMPTPRRVRLQIDERRKQLLDLGIEVFSSQPYEEISIESLAEAAGISKGLLYHYFRGKREFYVEAIRAASLQLRALTKPNPLLPPVERLRAAIDAHLNYLEEHGAVYTAIYRGGLAIAPEVGKVVEEHRQVVLRWFLKNMGIVRPRPVLRTALRAWISMVEGASLDWVAHRELERNDLCELLMAGYFAVLHKAVEIDPKAAAAAPIRPRTRAVTK